MITKVCGSHERLHSNLHAKPFCGHKCSGMHVHQSLWSKDMKQNMFYSDDAEKVTYQTGDEFHRRATGKRTKNVRCG